MSTSLLYHAFGARKYKYLRTEFLGGAVFFHIEKNCDPRCLECCSRNVVFDGPVEYTIRTLSIGFMPVFLVLHLHVIRCRDCGCRCQESRDVADPFKSYTRAFARFVLCLTKFMSIAAVASLLNVGWDLVKDIVKTDLKKRAKNRSIKRVKRIAIDEIAVKKGHRYMTVVLDLDTGWVIYTAEGKGKESLKNFFIRLRRAGAKLKAIAMDMSEAYRSAVEEYWPHPVAIINDHYHLVANMNTVLDTVRREEQNKLEAEGKEVIKGARYLLLYSAENIAKKPEKLARLNDLLAANETLNKAYLLKEELRLFWQQENRKTAKAFVVNWIKSAKSVGNKHLTKFAETIREHAKGILAWYKHRISTGPLEGTNNKIKVLKRMAYGYRDMEFFALKILFIHEAKYQLAGA